MRLLDWLLGRSTPSHLPDDTGKDVADPPPHAPMDDEDAEAAHEAAKDRLLFPRPKFQGEFTPENLAFDSNLQEFAQRVVYICSLENSGKISPDEAHQQIRSLYKELSRSHKGLKIADS